MLDSQTYIRLLGSSSIGAHEERRTKAFRCSSASILAIFSFNIEEFLWCAVAGLKRLILEGYLGLGLDNVNLSKKFLVSRSWHAKVLKS